MSSVEKTSTEITTIPNLPDFPIEIPLAKGTHEDKYFLSKESSLDVDDDAVYHLPYLFNVDGVPWYEGNLHFYKKATDPVSGYGTTEQIRAKASQLLDFKMFCDKRNIDYLDFSAVRPSARPSYKYFQYLMYETTVSARNLNERTFVVFEFYKFLSTLPGYSIDIERVEKTHSAFIKLSDTHYKQVEVRSQTVNASGVSNPVPLGYVRDEGEDLRPLSNPQRDELIHILSEHFNVDERLIHFIALDTGARKQSIFTLRLKHISMLTHEAVTENGEAVRTAAKGEGGTYILKAGPGTGIDTKFDKPQKLYFPEALIQQLKIYSESKAVKERRKLFREKHGDILSEDDMYLFISTKGNCHYMAKDDPRYRKVKTRPKGEHTDYFKKKLLKYASDKFPVDFTFHWTRATFAFTYYQYLQPMVEKKLIKPGDEIRRIQIRLHHSKRSITEHYLKLFINFDEVLFAQEKYEEHLFNGVLAH